MPQELRTIAFGAHLERMWGIGMRNVEDGSVRVERIQLVDRVHHVLRSGEIDIDPVCRTLQRRGQMINASPKVSSLVFHLAQHCDRAVEKGELVELIWPGVRVGESSLRWLLKEARRCLGDNGSSQEYIETVRGYGLRWTAGITVVECRRVQVISAGSAPPVRGTELRSVQCAAPHCTLGSQLPSSSSTRARRLR